jgi:DNA-binding NarL/FixJ family response regulator
MPERDIRGDHVTIVDWTDQRRDVLCLLLHGHDRQEVALQVKRSVRTVDWHIANLYQVTGVRSIGELHAWARDHWTCCDVGEVCGMRDPTSE